mmetsp:Transcript_149607/g.480178  ORF Transcript_149607/g.480178 Transcript_149607/m.480178 type:complete len:210 (+) Transcript_149607:981-1610(+)
MPSARSCAPWVSSRRWCVRPTRTWRNPASNSSRHSPCHPRRHHPPRRLQAWPKASLAPKPTMMKPSRSWISGCRPSATRTLPRQTPSEQNCAHWVLNLTRFGLRTERCQSPCRSILQSRRSWTVGFRRSETKTFPPQMRSATSCAGWALSRTISGLPTKTWVPRWVRQKSTIPTRRRAWSSGCRPSETRTSARPTPSVRSSAQKVSSQT